jgi:PhnB protein
MNSDNWRLKCDDSASTQVDKTCSLRHQSNPMETPTWLAKPKAQGIPSMTQIKAIPDGMHTVTPHLVCAGAADAIEFYKKAFDATETSRLPGPDGRLMHASIRIGDSTVMLVDEMPEHGALGPKSLNGSPVTIHLYVDDVDTFTAQALRAGAKSTMPVSDMFWGDRYGQIEDPFGHRWSIATHVRDVAPADMQKAMLNMFGKKKST